MDSHCSPTFPERRPVKIYILWLNLCKYIKLECLDHISIFTDQRYTLAETSIPIIFENGLTCVKRLKVNDLSLE